MSPEPPQRLRRARPRWAVAVTVAGSVAVAASPLLPWASSGRTVRSGFDLARLARSLGLDSSWAGRGLLTAMALLPVLAATTWLAAWLGRSGAVAALGAAIGGIAVVIPAVVWRAPVRAASGPAVSVVAGMTALVGAAALALAREPRCTNPTE